MRIGWRHSSWIGSPREGGRLSIDAEMRAASTGSALSGETGAMVAVTLPAQGAEPDEKE